MFDPRNLLIEPYGIEIRETKRSKLLNLLLIEPYGIEIRQIAEYSYLLFLLIEPYGIEMITNRLVFGRPLFF